MASGVGRGNQHEADRHRVTRSPTGRSHSFRVRSMSEDAWHVVLVPDHGHVICSCAGVNWCSHIDATLFAGERAMVPQEEWAEANRAQIAARGRIHPPEGWQAHWRTNRRWRGLPPARVTMLDRSRREGRPMMSIEGRGGERRIVQKLSEEAGWMVSSDPVKGCLFHVAPAHDSGTRASEKARENGVPIATYHEWIAIADQLARMMSHEIGKRTGIHLQDGVKRG